MFLEQCARDGILTNGSLLPSLAHDERAIVRTLSAFAAAATRVGELVAGGRSTIGESMAQCFSRNGSSGGGRAAGFLESIWAEPDQLHICGWMLLEDGPPDAIEAVAEDGTLSVASRDHRPDLAEAYPSIPDAASGRLQPFTARAPCSLRGATTRSRSARGAKTMSASHAMPCACASEHRSADHRPTRDEDGVLHL